MFTCISSLFIGNSYAKSFSSPDGIKSVPTASATSSRDTVCAGEIIDITITLTGTGPWIVTGTETVNGGTPNIFYDTITSPFTFQARPDPGNNVYNITDITDMGTGETNTGNVGGGDSINVFCHSLPHATGSITQGSVCLGQPIDININLTGTGPWIVNGTDSVTGGSLNYYSDTTPVASFSFQAIPDAGNNIYKIISIKDLATGCENIGNTGGNSFLSISVGPLPDLSISGSHSYSLCTGEQASLVFHFTNGVAPYTVQYSDESSITHTLVFGHDSTITLQYTEAGLHSFDFLTVADSHNCSKLVNFNTEITVYSIPQVSLADFSPLCDTIEKMMLSGGIPEGGMYSGRGVYSGYFYPAIAGGPGNYSITYTVQNGPCSDAKTKTMTVNLCRNLSISENENVVMQLYPNPSDGIFTLDLNNISGLAELQILNVEGQAVYAEMITGQLSYNKQIDMYGLTKGIYFIKVTGEHYTVTQKLIIK